MYNANRFGARSGVSNAIPSMGAIEGRMAVLEIVATTTLELLLHTVETKAAPQILLKIRSAMRNKCDGLHLSSADTRAAAAYAQDLIDAHLCHPGIQKPAAKDDGSLVA